MQAHANDLRSEVEREWDTVCPPPKPEPDKLDALVHQIVDNWRAAPLSNAMRALTEYAEKVTRTPAQCAREDIETLRRAGWCDGSIHDAVQVVAYFNYINRVADALGVEIEPGLPRWGSSA